MDDILVYGKDKAEHDEQLKKTLKTVEEAGITLNKEKCEFAKQRVKCLGHIIDANSICPDPDKVKAIVSMPEPTNIYEIHLFWGMANQL